jgi:outer membrane protein assembly factor BamB
MRQASLALAAAFLLAGSVPLVHDVVLHGAMPDWPQFLGPDRNGVYAGPALAETWPKDGPPKVWEISVGEGFAGPVVVGDRLILFHRRGSEEVVESFDTKSGKSQWRFAYRTNYRDDFGFDEGPRSVPVVANGRVYTFGAEGQLHAIDLETGKAIWNVDTMKRFSVRKGFFGAAGSPLVENGRVIANVGGTDGAKGAGIVAFNADTGEVLWTATDHQASYSSPVAGTFDGRRHVLFFTRNGLVSINPENGSIFFERPWRSRSQTSVNAATPLVIGELIFASATYETGATVMRLAANKLTELWASDEVMSNHYATSVHHNGTLYGYHGRQEFNPSLRAVDLNTGKVRWNVDRYRAGSITLVGDRLMIARETGELVLAPASPDAFKPIAQARVIRGTLRALPAVSDGFVYLRNENTLVCLDLRKS